MVFAPQFGIRGKTWHKKPNQNDSQPSAVRRTDIAIIHTRLNNLISEYCDTQGIALALTVDITDKCVTMFAPLYRALESAQSIPFAQVEAALTAENLAASLGHYQTEQDLVDAAGQVIVSSVEALRARRAAPPFLG